MTVQQNSWWVVVVLLMTAACGNTSENAGPGQGAAAPEASEAAAQGAEPVAEGPQHIDSFDPELQLDRGVGRRSRRHGRAGRGPSAGGLLA